MNPIIKQRLVGSLLLVALAIVFWPIIFVQPTSDRPFVGAPIPDRPAVDTSAIEPPVSPRIAMGDSYRAPRVDPSEQASADEATTLTELSAQAVIEASQQLPEATDLDPPTTRQSAPVTMPVDDRGYVQSWVLQVAAVQTQSRANALVAQLQAKGYEAFARALKREDKPLWRVQIGPKLERAKLNTIKPVVDKAFGVNATILRYEQ